MPEIRPSKEADRRLHAFDNARPRKGGDVINAPDDLLEGAGDMVVLDKYGNPVGAANSPAFELVSPETPDGWYPYLGTAPQGVNSPTKQADSPLPIGRHSWMGSQPIIPGDLPPSLLVAAKLARPEAPILVAEPVGTEGYTAASATSPFFVELSYMKNGRHGPLSPATVVPPVANGQSIRVYLPDQIPKDVDHVGIWLTEPGTSTASTPGRFRLQREVEVSQFNPKTYDLTGPYRMGKLVPDTNETQLPQGNLLDFAFNSASRPCRPGTFVALHTWTDKNGESLPGPATGEVIVTASSIYSDDQGNPVAGSGLLRITLRATPPPDATGWRPYVYLEGQWHAVWDSYNNWGNEVPYPLEQTSVVTTGWSSASDNAFVKNERVFLTQRDYPSTNTTGIEGPTDAPNTPAVFGAPRPPADTYYAFITETLRGRETIRSPISDPLAISSNQIPRIIRRDHVNLTPNHDNTEIGQNGLPLDQTIVTTNGSAKMDGSDLVLTAQDPSGTATTPSSTTRATDVDVSKLHFVEVELEFENPPTGTLSGSAEAVLEELSASGVTQTSIGTTNVVGEIIFAKPIYPAGSTGLPAGSLVWHAGTTQYRILVRFLAGSPKNATVRVKRRPLYPHGHKPRRNHPERRRRKRIRPVYPPGTPGPPPSPPPPQPPPEPPPDLPVDIHLAAPEPPPEPGELPPGSEVDAIPPPVAPDIYEPLPGVSPALVAWPVPDRPSSSGTALEFKHDFDTAMPPNWIQATAGQATLSRVTGSSLVGSGYLRSLKSVAGP